MKRKTIKGITPNSGLAPASTTPWLRLKMHDAVGATTIAYDGGDGAGNAVSGTLDISAAGTIDWQQVTKQPTNVTGVAVNWASTGSAVGNGTLAFASAGSTLSWAEAGDSAGTPVAVASGNSYTLVSGTTGKSINVTVSGTLPGADVSDLDIAVSATVGPFCNQGEFTSAGDNGLQITSTLDATFSALWQKIMRTDNLGGGTILYFGNASILKLQHASTLFTYLSSINNVGGVTGWGVKISSGKRFQIIYQNAALGTSPVTGVLSEGNVPEFFGGYVQGDTTIEIGIKKLGETVSTSSGTGAYCGVQTTYDVQGGIFADLNSNSSLYTATELDAGCRCSEILIVRASGDLRANLDTYMAEYSAKGNFPPSLNGI